MRRGFRVPGKLGSSRADPKFPDRGGSRWAARHGRSSRKPSRLAAFEQLANEVLGLLITLARNPRGLRDYDCPDKCPMTGIRSCALPPRVGRCHLTEGKYGSEETQEFSRIVPVLTNQMTAI